MVRLVEPVRRVGDPGHHDLRRVGIGEAILLGEAVEGIGVVGGPHLIGVAQDAEIDAPAAAGAGFDLHLGMPLPQLGENSVEVARELDIDFLLLRGRKLVPAGLAPVAVVVPLEKGDVVFGEQLVEEAEDVVAHIGAGEIEHQLVALLRLAGGRGNCSTQSGCLR